MLRVSNIRIGTKLIAMSALGVLLVAGLMISQSIANLSIREAAATADRQQAVNRELAGIRASTRGMEIAVRDLRLAETPEQLKEAMKLAEGRYGNAQKRVDSLLALVTDAENRQRIERVKSLSEQYIGTTRQIEKTKGELITLQMRGVDDPNRFKRMEDQLAAQVRDRALPLAAEIETLSVQTSDSAEGLMKQASAVADATMSNAEILGLGIGGVIILVLIGSAVFGVVSIARPLRALVSPIDALAAGNFNISIEGVGRKDEVGQIATAIDTMAVQVRGAMSEIKQAALEVNSASSEITTSTTDLSQRTEEQAASLEETTAAMEEVAATVRRTAENAELANKSADQARTVADQGGQVVAKAVDAMAKIEDSSRKISDIIGVIDEIARQTNLLALNAAVEAARAGEAGRGFAVVASEVRSLAQRSSQAAKDIKELITNSNGQVKDGVDLVNHAGGALAKIVDSVKDVASLVSDIARATTEQATGLDQINKALTQMDEVTQQNAALVEENAATAKALETQAQSMDDQVAFFKIEEEASQARAKVAVNARMSAGPGAGAPRTFRPAAPAKSSSAKSSSAKSSIVKSTPMKPAIEKPMPAPMSVSAAPKSAAAASAKSARNPVGSMQTALASALDAEQEWKDF